jgi:hypothetical protein
MRRTAAYAADSAFFRQASARGLHHGKVNLKAKTDGGQFARCIKNAVGPPCATEVQTHSSRRETREKNEIRNRAAFRTEENELLESSPLASRRSPHPKCRSSHPLMGPQSESGAFAEESIRWTCSMHPLINREFLYLADEPAVAGRLASWKGDFKCKAY